MRIRYTLNARECISEIHEYISRENPQAASRVVSSIRSQILTLAEQPNSGRLGRCEGTREFVISLYPYIVAYRIKGDELHILAVVHTSRQWPDMPSQ